MTPTRQELTRSQQEAFATLVRLRDKYGAVPPVRELQAYLGYRSDVGVIDLLKRLQERGWLTWPTQDNGRRPTAGITLMEEEDDMDANEHPTKAAGVSWNLQGVRIAVQGRFSPEYARDVARAILGACRDGECAIAEEAERMRKEGRS
jgi:SOS-response transcriptional repressor LexA